MNGELTWFHRRRWLSFERLESRKFLDASGLLSRSADLEEDLISVEKSSTLVTNKALVAFKIQLTDMHGAAIETIRVDDEFRLNIFAQDLRDLPSDNLRLFSAYTALQYDSNLIEATERGLLGSDFWSIEDRITYDESAHRISPYRELGGLVKSLYPNGLGHLLYSLTLRAVAEGEVSIATKPPPQGEVPFRYDTLLYDYDFPLTIDQIEFESRELSIRPRDSAPSPVSSVDVRLPTLVTTLATQQALPANPSSELTLNPLGTYTQPSSPTQPAAAQVLPSLSSIGSSNLNSDQADTAEPSASQLPTNLNTEERTTENVAALEVLADQIGSTAHYTSLHFNRIEVTVLRDDDQSYDLPADNSELGRARIDVYFADRDSRSAIDLTLRSIGRVDRRPSEYILHHRISMKSDGIITEKRNSNRIEHDKRRFAADVIDRILERIGPAMNSHSESFAWEASYHRRLMVRLPFQKACESETARSLCGDGFADISIPRRFDIAWESGVCTFPEYANGEKLDRRDVEIVYARSSLKLLDGISKPALVETHEPAAADSFLNGLGDSGSTRPKSLVDQADVSESPSDVTKNWHWTWRSCLIVSLSFAFRRSSRLKRDSESLNLFH